MLLIQFYDYIFYRSCIAYIEGKEPPISYVSGLIAVIQFCSILTIIVLFNIVYDFFYIEKYILITMLLIFIILSYLRYERNFDFMELHAKWENEDKLQRKVRGYMIVVYMIVVVLTPMVFGYLRHNLGMI